MTDFTDQQIREAQSIAIREIGQRQTARMLAESRLRDERAALPFYHPRKISNNAAMVFAGAMILPVIIGGNVFLEDFQGSDVHKPFTAMIERLVGNVPAGCAKN